MKIILNIFIALSISFPAFAQSMRAPTLAEKKVLMRVIDPINQNINSLVNNNWEMTESINDQELDVPNGSKSQFGTGYLITLKLKEDATIYKQSMEKINQFVQGKNEDSIESAYAELQKKSEIHIDIDLNDGAIGLGTMPNKSIQLKIPGISKAFIVAQDNYSPNRKGAIVIAFGKWENAKYDSENKCYRFRFQHPPQTPFIENVVIEIHGDTDRIKEVLKQSDWSNVATSLD